MPKLREDTIDARIFTRQRGGTRPRYYADFRDFSDHGGSQESLCPPGDRYATTDREVARELAEARLEALTEQVALLPRRTRATDRALGNVIRHHLRMKAASGEGTEQWLGNVRGASHCGCRLLRRRPRHSARAAGRCAGICRLARRTAEWTRRYVEQRLRSPVSKFSFESLSPCD